MFEPISPPSFLLWLFGLENFQAGYPGTPKYMVSRNMHAFLLFNRIPPK
jgi:hypothetical protein